MAEREERMAKLEGLAEQMSQRLNHIDTRLDRIEGRFDGLQAGFGSLEARFGALEARFGGLEVRFDRLEARFDSWLRWVLGSILALGGTMLTMWATLMVATVLE